MPCWESETGRERQALRCRRTCCAGCSHSSRGRPNARSTLEAAGYTGRFRRGDIVGYSPADLPGNVRIHGETNDALFRVLVNGDVGECIHITGKMNALADPLHRRLCAEVARRTKTRFSVVYQADVDPPSEAMGVALDSARRWSRARWFDKLAAVRLIGDEFVDVRTAPTKDAIQYTVFGNRFTQLQAQHSDMSAKQIWLIRSEDVNGFLTDKARATLEAASEVEEAAFRDFFARMNGVTSHNILARLVRAAGRYPHSPPVGV